MNSEGKTYCVPKLSFNDVPPVGEYDDMGSTSTSCSSASGLDSCVGEIVNGNLDGIVKADELTPADDLTPIKELTSNNTFKCSLFVGCTITAGIPPSCTDFSGQDTLYKKITADSSFVSMIDPTTSTNNPDVHGICPAGYRRSVTWTYDEIAFSNPGTATAAAGYIFKNNCSFCEKVLFGASVLDQYAGESAKVNIEGITTANA